MWGVRIPIKIFVRMDWFGGFDDDFLRYLAFDEESWVDDEHPLAFVSLEDVHLFEAGDEVVNVVVCQRFSVSARAYCFSAKVFETDVVGDDAAFLVVVVGEGAGLEADHEGLEQPVVEFHHLVDGVEVYLDELFRGLAGLGDNAALDFLVGLVVDDGEVRVEGVVCFSLCHF